MSSFTAFKYFINNTVKKVEGSTTLDLNTYYSTTMTKSDVMDLNGTMNHSYFGEGNLKDSKISEALMCTVLGANNTNVIGKQDSCFHDGKVQHEKHVEYISMKASRRAQSANKVLSQTPLKLYQFFNMTSGKIDIDDVMTNWQMTLSNGSIEENNAVYLKKLLDNNDYCDKICSIYDYTPNEYELFSVATSYPGIDGLVYVEKTDPVSAQRMFVAAVTIQSMGLFITEYRLSVKVTNAIFGESTTVVGIRLLDPKQEAGMFAALRDLVLEKVSSVGDIRILDKINKFLDQCQQE